MRAMQGWEAPTCDWLPGAQIERGRWGPSDSNSNILIKYEAYSQHIELLVHPGVSPRTKGFAESHMELTSR